jgi:hypothetical protein
MKRKETRRRFPERPLDEQSPRTIGDDLKAKIWHSTSRCYTRALKDTYPNVFKKWDDKRLDEEWEDHRMRSVLSAAGLDDRNPVINRHYMDRVLQLSTQELNLIIEADKQGVIRRAGETIDAILNELLTRSLDPETKAEHD